MKKPPQNDSFFVDKSLNYEKEKYSYSIIVEHRSIEEGTYSSRSFVY